MQNLKEFDRFQSVVLQVSEFGIVQMTRKRSGKTLMRQLMDTCHCCQGLGQLTSVRAASYEVLRKIKQSLKQYHSAGKVELIVSEGLFDFIASIEFDSVLALEQQFGCQVVLHSDANMKQHEFKVVEKSLT